MTPEETNLLKLLKQAHKEAHAQLRFPLSADPREEQAELVLPDEVAHTAIFDKLRNIFGAPKELVSDESALIKWCFTLDVNFTRWLLQNTSYESRDLQEVYGLFNAQDIETYFPTSMLYVDAGYSRYELRIPVGEGYDDAISLIQRGELGALFAPTYRVVSRNNQVEKVFTLREEAVQAFKQNGQWPFLDQAREMPAHEDPPTNQLKLRYLERKLRALRDDGAFLAIKWDLQGAPVAHKNGKSVPQLDLTSWLSARPPKGVYFYLSKSEDENLRREMLHMFNEVGKDRLFQNARELDDAIRFTLNDDLAQAILKDDALGMAQSLHENAFPPGSSYKIEAPNVRLALQEQEDCAVLLLRSRTNDLNALREQLKRSGLVAKEKPYPNLRIQEHPDEDGVVAAVQIPLALVGALRQAHGESFYEVSGLSPGADLDSCLHWATDHLPAIENPRPDLSKPQKEAKTKVQAVETSAAKSLEEYLAEAAPEALSVTNQRMLNGTVNHVLHINFKHLPGASNSQKKKWSDGLKAMLPELTHSMNGSFVFKDEAVYNRFVEAAKERFFIDETVAPVQFHPALLDPVASKTDRPPAQLLQMVFSPSAQPGYVRLYLAASDASWFRKKGDKLVRLSQHTHETKYQPKRMTQDGQRPALAYVVLPEAVATDLMQSPPASVETEQVSSTRKLSGLIKTASEASTAAGGTLLMVNALGIPEKQLSTKNWGQWLRSEWLKPEEATVAPAAETQDTQPQTQAPKKPNSKLKAEAAVEIPPSAEDDVATILNSLSLLMKQEQELNTQALCTVGFEKTGHEGKPLQPVLYFAASAKALSDMKLPKDATPGLKRNFVAALHRVAEVQAFNTPTKKKRSGKFQPMLYRVPIKSSQIHDLLQHGGVEAEWMHQDKEAAGKEKVAPLHASIFHTAQSLDPELLNNDKLSRQLAFRGFTTERALELFAKRYEEIERQRTSDTRTPEQKAYDLLAAQELQLIEVRHLRADQLDGLMADLRKVETAATNAGFATPATMAKLPKPDNPGKSRKPQPRAVTQASALRHGALLGTRANRLTTRQMLQASDGSNLVAPPTALEAIPAALGQLEALRHGVDQVTALLAPMTRQLRAARHNMMRYAAFANGLGLNRVHQQLLLIDPSRRVMEALEQLGDEMDLPPERYANAAGEGRDVVLLYPKPQMLKKLTRRLRPATPKDADDHETSQELMACLPHVSLNAHEVEFLKKRDGIEVTFDVHGHAQISKQDVPAVLRGRLAAREEIPKQTKSKRVLPQADAATLLQQSGAVPLIDKLKPYAVKLRVEPSLDGRHLRAAEPIGEQYALIVPLSRTQRKSELLELQKIERALKNIEGESFVVPAKRYGGILSKEHVMQYLSEEEQRMIGVKECKEQLDNFIHQFEGLALGSDEYVLQQEKTAHESGQTIAQAFEAHFKAWSEELQLKADEVDSLMARMHTGRDETQQHERHISTRKQAYREALDMLRDASKQCNRTLDDFWHARLDEIADLREQMVELAKDTSADTRKTRKALSNKLQELKRLYDEETFVKARGRGMFVSVHEMMQLPDMLQTETLDDSMFVAKLDGSLQSLKEANDKPALSHVERVKDSGSPEYGVLYLTKAGFETIQAANGLSSLPKRGEEAYRNGQKHAPQQGSNPLANPESAHTLQSWLETIAAHQSLAQEHRHRQG